MTTCPRSRSPAVHRRPAAKAKAKAALAKPAGAPVPTPDVDMITRPPRILSVLDMDMRALDDWIAAAEDALQTAGIKAEMAQVDLDAAMEIVNAHPGLNLAVSHPDLQRRLSAACRATVSLCGWVREHSVGWGDR